MMSVGTKHTAESMGLRTKTMASAIKVDMTANGVRVLEYQPGNGTRYVVTIADVRHMHTNALDALGLGLNGGFVITVLTGLMTPRAMVLSFSPGGMLHWSYVMEKLKCSQPEGVVLAELLAGPCDRICRSTADLVADANALRDGE